MRRLSYVLPLLLCLIVLSSCAAGTPDAPSLSSLPAAGNAQAGQALFEQGSKNAQACSSCHSVDSTAEVGPSLAGIASRAASRVAGQSAEQYLFSAIVRPDDFVVPGYAAGLMPNTYAAVLSPQHIRDLISFLQTLN